MFKKIFFGLFILVCSTLAAQAQSPQPCQWNYGFDANGTAQASYCGTVTFPNVPQKIITSDYTIAPSDCGETIIAGSGTSGYFNITLPSATTFPKSCKINFINGDTTRAKRLIGFPSISYNRMYPAQTWGIENVSGIWKYTLTPGRWKLWAPTTFFVDPVNGDDANDGLAAGVGGAFQTRLHAWAVMASTVDCNQQTMTLQHAAGTYTDAFFNDNWTPIGCSIALLGNTANPDSVILAGPGNSPAIQIGSTSCTKIAGFEFLNASSSSFGLYVHENGCAILNGNNDFSTFPGGQIVVNTGYLLINSNYEISGSAPFHIDAILNGRVEYNTGITVTINNAPNFSQAFVYANGLGNISVPNPAPTFVNGSNVTGIRYSSNLNSAIQTNGDGPNAFPGSIAGTTATGGQYN